MATDPVNARGLDVWVGSVVGDSSGDATDRSERRCAMAKSGDVDGVELAPVAGLSPKPRPCTDGSVVKWWASAATAPDIDPACFGGNPGATLFDCGEAGASSA